MLALPSLDISLLGTMFPMEEVDSIIKDLRFNETPSPDSFTWVFFKMAWSIINFGVTVMFIAFAGSDTRTIYLINGALTILPPKKHKALT
jgi:hypothetical protein